ncbi:hypothetical protein HT031_000573 [Scenedesmus sp. PABB004]|nr:hypothetical protein HT031_000573 [Scenedesmus sp. PABB004]
MEKGLPLLSSVARGLRLKPAEAALVLGVGLVCGLVLGYIVMGTAHAMFDIGAEEHYRHDG